MSLMQQEELAHWLRLQLTPGVGNISARLLLRTFGLPQQVFAQTRQALAEVVSASQVAALLQEPPELQALLQHTWQWLQADREGRKVIVLGDPSYPQSLLDIEDPPILLYAMGSPSAWQPEGLAQCASRSIAIVGSRNPTPQGQANAQQFAHAFAQAGLSVVSGLALGIDGAAHMGALAGATDTNTLPTLAVVGTGLDRVYPKQHLDLAHRIALRGVVLSEYALGTPPLAANFPKRNRLISGLSSGTLVVEAALQSGSLITARLAAEQGKEVFAIPGSIHSTQARGCHALIKQGAKLVECAQDVWEELKRMPGASSTSTPETQKPNVPADKAIASNTDSAADAAEQQRLLKALGFDPVGLDALQTRTGLDTPTLQVQLMRLELQGKVARLPGSLFQQIH